MAAGKGDPTGKQRRREQRPDKALANSGTLNRLGLTPADADADTRYNKIVADDERDQMGWDYRMPFLTILPQPLRPRRLPRSR